MAAEIIMIVENEDARLGARTFPVEICSRQSAQTGAHHDKIIGFASAFRIRELCAITFGMRDRIGPFMVPTQPMTQGRIIGLRH